MIELTSKKMQYVETIAEKFPHTIFIWCFIKPNETELKWTKPKIYPNINLQVFWRKPNIFRNALWNDHSDEWRFDFDNLKMEDNINDAVILIDKLKSVGIKKTLLYKSGGKGLHLHFRYENVFGDFDRADIRRAIFDNLNIKLKAVDESIFQTTQILGLEGFKHRKTNQVKELIQLDNNKIITQNRSLEFKYLEDDFVNKFNNDFGEKVFSDLSGPKNKKVVVTDTTYKTPPVFYNDKIFNWHYDRFKFMYNNLDDGKKRCLDMLRRWLLLRIKNEEVVRYYYKKFCDDNNIIISNDEIILRVNHTLKSIDKQLSLGKNAAPFLYHDVFTKEDFYKTYNKERLNI